MTTVETETTEPHEDAHDRKSPRTRSESMLHGCYGVVPVKSDKEGYKYDSFMVYATADRPWVRQLVGQLEESKGYRVCIECRDFVAGRPFSDNFQESVECSRKIVIVLSQAFLQSEWCDMVCQFAARHVSKIIPIKREECRCPQIIGDLDFIDMTCEVALEYFWEKLVQSLEFQSNNKGKGKSKGDDSVPVTTYNVNIHTVGEGGNVAVGQGACVTSTQETGNAVYENDKVLAGSTSTGKLSGATNGNRRRPTSRGSGIVKSKDEGGACVTNQLSTNKTLYTNVSEPSSMWSNYVNSQFTGLPVRDDPQIHRQDTVRRQASNQIENVSLLAEDGAVFSDEKYVGPSKDNNLYHQQYATYLHGHGGRWEVQPLSGVVVYGVAGSKETELNSFQNDVDDYLERFARMAGDKRETAEQFILQVVLSGLEKTHNRPGFRAMDNYRMLAKLSCCKNSPSVVKHSLSQLLNLLSRDKSNDYSDYCKTRIKTVEKIIRSSLMATDGIYTEEGPIQHRQRLTVYSRLISLFTIYSAQGHLLFFTEEDFQELQRVIKRLESVSLLHVSYKKKDRLRYSVEFITEGIKRLLDLKKNSVRLTAVLQECQTVLDGEVDARAMECLRMFSEGKMDWFSVHVTLLYLHSQTHDNDKAIFLIWSVIKAKQANSKSPWRTGAKIDWRFALIAATLLTDICMNHKEKDIRVIAGSILADYLKAEEMKKSAEVRAIIERHTARALFCPDEPTIKIMAYQLFRKEETDISCKTLLKFLCWNYRNQSLETCETISNSSWNFIKHGFFRGKEVAVKVLKVKIQDILQYSEKATHRAKSRLTAEVYSLRRLNETPHPNIVRVFGYNTDRRPYHVITEYMSRGNLLQFLRESRRKKPLPPVHILLQMCINIVDGLTYLYSRRLVHIKLMAENILVGEKLVCKIGGLHSIRQVKPRQASEGEYSYSMDAFPVVVSKEDAESVPVRWLAPEAMNLGWFSIASEVWSLGVTLYEIFTYGCVPYLRVNTTEKGITSIVNDQDVKAYVQNGNQLPKEACFEEGIYDIICRCCMKNQYNRPLELLLVKHHLLQLQENLYAEGNIDERPRPNPPQLKIIEQRDRERDNIDECDDTEDIYSTVESPKLKEKLHHFSDGRFTSARPEPSVVHGEGVTVEWVDDINLSHLRRLLFLENPNLIRLLAVNPCGAIVELISEPATQGNLRDYVLANQCSEADRLLFLTQIATAMKYLHCQHIVHGELRAENVAVVITNGFQVKVSRLGRSKPLHMSPYEVNSISCVVDSAMPLESIRWSAPEVIQSGHYTHAADVWSFGVLSWELYMAATAGQAATADDITPYKEIKGDEILGHLQDDHRLPKPALCPDWVHIVTTQCCLYWRRERPPFIALLDCLTSSNPWQSWMVQLWLKRHEKELTSDWPDRTITQPDNARHVLPATDHPQEEVLWKMCSEEFLADHTYHYVPSHLRLRECRGLDEDDPGYDKPYATAQSLKEMSQLRPARSTVLQKGTTANKTKAPTGKDSGLIDEDGYYKINDVPHLLVGEHNNPAVNEKKEEGKRSAMALPDRTTSRQDEKRCQHSPDVQMEERLYEIRADIEIRGVISEEKEHERQQVESTLEDKSAVVSYSSQIYDGNNNPSITDDDQEKVYENDKRKNQSNPSSHVSPCYSSHSYYMSVELPDSGFDQEVRKAHDSDQNLTQSSSSASYSSHKCECYSNQMYHTADFLPSTDFDQMNVYENDGLANHDSSSSRHNEHESLSSSNGTQIEKEKQETMTTSVKDTKTSESGLDVQFYNQPTKSSSIINRPDTKSKVENKSVNKRRITKPSRFLSPDLQNYLPTDDQQENITQITMVTSNDVIVNNSANQTSPSDRQDENELIQIVSHGANSHVVTASEAQMSRTNHGACGLSSGDVSTFINDQVQEIFV